MYVYMTFRNSNKPGLYNHQVWDVGNHVGIRTGLEASEERKNGIKVMKIVVVYNDKD